jgi:hypothetical protein
LECAGRATAGSSGRAARRVIALNPHCASENRVAKADFTSQL